MSNLDPAILNLLEDISRSAKRILSRLQDQNLDIFVGKNDLSLDLQDIAARQMTIIGEAATRLLKKYPDFCEQHSEIPLQQARRMRNVLVHDYGKVDWRLVWDTAHDELPQLVVSIAPYTSPGSEPEEGGGDGPSP